MDILKNFDLLFVGLTVVAIGILGFVVFLNNRKSITSKSFLVFSLTTVLYSLFNYFYYTTTGKNPIITLWLLRFTIFSATWHAFSMFQLFFVFPEGKKKFPRYYFSLLLPVVIFVSFLTLTKYTFWGIEEDGITAKQSYGLIPFALIVVSLMFFGVLLLVRKTLKTTGPIKNQFKLVLTGTVFTFILIFLFNIILPNVYLIVKFISFTPIYFLPYIFFTSYAVLKQGLFNVKVIATELLVFSLWILILVRTLLSDRWQDWALNGGLLIILVVIGIFLIRSVFREVTQREKIEKLAQELNQSNNKLWVANEKLQELDRVKTEFVSMATHQLRSPLTAIKGYASMLLENSFGPVEEKARGAVDIIFQSSQKLVKVIEDFLNITRMELGTMKYEQSEFDFKNVVESISKELEVNVEKKGLQFLLEVDPTGDYKLTGDSGKLAQVVGNLIDNAIKYTPSGWIKVTLGRAENKIRLTISDSGVGMPAEVIPKLFQKFTRAGDAGKINISGTGLGLYVAKQIVEAHQGKIWAESEGVGKGSKFVVEV